ESEEAEDGTPSLRAVRTDGATLGVQALSYGTADLLYLALRLAALELRAATADPMPLVLDDVLVSADDARARAALRALAEFADAHQVLLFTHDRHLVDLAREAIPPTRLAV